MREKLKEFGIDTPAGREWAKRKRREFLLGRIGVLDRKRSWIKTRLTASNRTEHILLVGQLEKIEKERRRFKQNLYFLDRPESHSRLKDEEIERARQADIRRLLDEKPDRRNKIKCFVHDDENPSMHVYENNLFCFGCEANFDTIAYVMHKRNLDFVNAVKYINTLD